MERKTRAEKQSEKERGRDRPKKTGRDIERQEETV